MGGKEGLSQIGARVRELLAADPRAGGEIRQARAAFLDEVDRRNVVPPSRGGAHGARRRRLALLLSAFTVAGVIAALWFGKRPITFRIGEAHQGLVGDLVEAPPGQRVPVAFSEGSSLMLHDGGRMRVLSLDGGAGRVSVRVLLEGGALDAIIAHRRGVTTNWRFEAGPYQVTVTGTTFHMQLREGRSSLRVSTEEGRVVVSGGCLQSPAAIGAGQTLEASCPTIQPSGEEAPAAASLPGPPAKLGLKPRSTRPERWRELLASGRLQEGLRAAEQANFARVCQTASPQELLALADAGRFFGPYTRAIAALGALRRRFPGTGDAGTAAFTLGRIAFDNENAYGRAAKWFDIYLQEQPTGPLMGDAFGRLIEARLRSGDGIGARASAQQYLRRFPGGPYASEARGILSK